MAIQNFIFLLFCITLVSLQTHMTMAQDQDHAIDYTDVPVFDSKVAAHQHCPRDIIVWVDKQTNTFYLKGQLWYGTTENGGYMCRNDAWDNGIKGEKSTN
jgi:hypothetical protein